LIRIAVLRAGAREAFPPVAAALRDPNGLLAAGGDLSPARLLDAYAQGIFPWFSEGEPILWWSPDPRMVFHTQAMHVPRRLARWLRSCDWRADADVDFAAVVQACAAPRDGHAGTWITPSMQQAYQRLHELGHAHSVEVFDAAGQRTGAIYGVAVGQMFFGESMVSLAGNGSKAALLALAWLLARRGWPLLDAQVTSGHLQTLGAVEVARAEFIGHVAALAALPGLEGSWRGSLDGLRMADLAAV
jgi:leucyl/phenylalanyl-tRNA---protein transferase